MNKGLLAVLTIGLLLGATGCAHETKGTPIVMAFNASAIDFSKLESMKQATICRDLRQQDGDLSILRAAKVAGVKHVVYVDTSLKTNSASGQAESCLTVYGE